MRKFLKLLGIFAIFPIAGFAQSPPQIPLTGNIGVQGNVAILGGITVQMPGDANYTLTSAQWSNKTIIVTSAVSLTATRNIVAPLNKGQEFNVENKTTGGQNITIIGATGTGVTVANGMSASVFTDGTNYIQNSGSGGSSLVVQTNSTNNSSQASLNLQSGAGISISNPSGGNVTVVNSAPMPSQANIYMVCEGDSRMANSTNSGANGLPGQDLCTQISKQSNFSSITGFTDLAVGGSTCATMTARYASGAHNYRPGGSAVPGNVTKTIMPLEIGVNDLRSSVSAIAEETCVSSYIQTAAADGITVIPMTVYWYPGYTDAQAVQNSLFNDWIRQLPFNNLVLSSSLPFAFDYDLFFPPESNSPYYQTAATPVNILSVSVTSNVLSVTTSTQTYTSPNNVLLSGFTAGTPAACLNGQTVAISATGLSSTTFQAPIGCPNISTTSTSGFSQFSSYGAGLHMGPNGNTLAAQDFNSAYTVSLTGAGLNQPNSRDIETPPSGVKRVNGCLYIGAVGLNNCNVPGGIYSTSPLDPTQGIIYLGNSFIWNRSSTGTTWTMVGGPLVINGSTGGGFSFQGGSIGAYNAAASTAIRAGATGSLISCTNSTCTTGLFTAGSQNLSFDGTNWNFAANLNLLSFKLNSSQTLNGVQGSTGTNIMAATGTFTAGLPLTTDANGNAIQDTAGFSGTKTAGTCVLTISNGLITGVTGC